MRLPHITKSRRHLLSLASVAALAPLSAQVSAETITVATVNNADMVVMQSLTSEFEKAHPDITLDWVVLEENVLRQRLTTDVATQGGQFDVMTIGTYEVPIWAKHGWLTKLDNLPEDYQVDDLIKPVRDGLSVTEGEKKGLYALPFYGESSMLYYRKDLFEQAGIEMPEQPTWSQVNDWAAKLNSADEGVYGICLRGKPGWGENMAVLGTMVNSFGGRWFNEEWEPQLDSPAWSEAINFYVDMMGKYGPRARLPTASTRTWHCSPAASAACGSTPPRRPASSTTRRNLPWPTSWASRRHRSPRRRRARIGCGPGRWRFRNPPSPRMPPRPSLPGPLPRNT